MSKGLLKISGYQGSNQIVLPCGVDAHAFYPLERAEARKRLGWDTDAKYALFAGAFNNEVKNSQLAKAAIARIPDAQLVELRGYSREQVNLAMNAANCLLMTSINEGSPVVTKEAMACGTPIVSVNVGDVKDTTADVDGCYITSYDESEIANSLKKAFAFQGKTQGRDFIFQRGLVNEQLVKELLSIYQLVKK